jgi:hypothetical protein
MTREEFIETAGEMFIFNYRLSLKMQIELSSLVESLNSLASSFMLTRTSDYQSYEDKLAYAARYGMRTAFQTWRNLQQEQDFTAIKKIMLIGGGPAFELPFILEKMPTGSRVEVCILDKEAGWKMYRPWHERSAGMKALSLSLEWVASGNLSEVNQFRPDLLVLSNVLGDLPSALLSDLAGHLKQVPNYLIQEVGSNAATLINQVTGTHWTDPGTSEKFPYREIKNYVTSRGVPDIICEVFWQRLEDKSFCRKKVSLSSRKAS